MKFKYFFKSLYVLLVSFTIIFMISCNESTKISDNNLDLNPKGIDTVYYFKPGSGQNAGQNSIYYPNNIFGLPDKYSSYLLPSTNPNQILSIGIGGEIIVGFNNEYIYDGDGADFTIFENAFLNPINNKIFAEPAKVAVSLDGNNYYEFPYDSLTLEGCAGTNPTNGSQNCFDPLVSGGNSFDIAKLGLKKIAFIKITDISEIILKNKNHPFYDVTISGFDLDAVIGLNLETNK